ncbi:U3 small nucleolar RNA-associated protein 13 [Phlyctochytrium bullatum]|nr:U3 small nucleolar RNA-associated protein 13 [Phlyctochytrium bullatum]
MCPKFLDKKRSRNVEIRSLFTFKAHDKDINAIAVAPNDKVFATGSQDKAAKIWSCQDGSLVGELRGHRRGIWALDFSPVDQVLATSSADKTIRLWSLADFTCLKTLESHLNSVLRVSFLSSGMQLLSSGSDGLVKLWNIRSADCVNTFDYHDDKVWALAIKSDETLIATGGGDATIAISKDCTEDDELQKNQELEDKLTMQQDLENCLLRGDFKNAFTLGLELGQPYRLISMLSDLRRYPTDSSSVTGSIAVDNVISSLGSDKIEKLLEFIRDWNTHSRYAAIAQSVLNVLLRSHSPEKLLKVPRIKEIIDGLSAYSSRHLGIAEDTLKNSHLLNYTLDHMDDMMGAAI